MKADSSAPSISLPRGGGAIKGIGEKFAANAVNGTASMTVPIACSPGRSGFGPQLSLTYDSGSGNGPFGFGWSLSLPQISRKTEKGLPQYRDAQESDVFILSGAEDLVPLLDTDGSRFIDRATNPGYTIYRYRPRIEGLFARIERWSRDADGDIHWRSISRDNILTVYGRDPSSRISNPEDPVSVFAWLICESRDDKGNAIFYEYKPEDGAGVDLTRAHQRNRGKRDDRGRTANRYIKRIRYGNRKPLLDDEGRRPRALSLERIDNAGWMFEIVFDYGEHRTDAPTPHDTREWTHRADAFSSYRAGFEVRTSRLCDRVLMFHHFPGEPDVGADCLVRSTDFTHSHELDAESAQNPVYSFLLSVTQCGYKRKDVGYRKSSFPPLEFQYTQPVVQDTVQDVDAASLENLPIGLDGAAYQWTDLHGEGIAGILTEQAGTWFYKRNLSPISERPVEFAPVERVALKPNLTLAGGTSHLMDLAGDGQLDLVVVGGPTPGFYEHDDEEGWQPFRPFASRLNREFRDPNLKFVDLDGDGHVDVLVSEDDALVWHASLAERGFGTARRVAQASDEEKGPRLVFADSSESIYLADLSGDGLTDLVRIRNGEVCYWPNLGYGRFGAKVTMDFAPQFDHPDQFDQRRIRLADIDGTGTADIIYLHADGVRLYFNQSGNSWGQPHRLKVFPRIDDLVSIVPIDLLGNGTASLVWSSPLPGDARKMRYVDLMGARKPHLLVKAVNNLGAETVVHYDTSTKFYLQDKRDERPWITRLPFPVHVVERVETYDRISRNRFVTRYRYHHGYFDGEEREFRGFGMVEQWDTEHLAALSNSNSFPEGDNVASESHVPPVLTKTWFHTGVCPGSNHLADVFADLALNIDVPQGLTPSEEREAYRALKGMMLRQEIYGLDASEKQPYPYTVTERRFSVRDLQQRRGNRHAVFFTHAREAISYHSERNPNDPRVHHTLTLEVDRYGNVLQSVAIGYGRRQADLSLPLPEDREKQTTALILYTQNSVTNAIDGDDDYRTPLPSAARAYDMTGFAPSDSAGHFSFHDWAGGEFSLFRNAAEIGYLQDADRTVRQKRLVEHVRTMYRKNDLTALLPLGAVESLALPGESYKLALTSESARRLFVDSGKLPEPELSSVMIGEGGYVNAAADENWWVPSGRVFFHVDADVITPENTAAEEVLEARAHFFMARKFADPFQHAATVSYLDDLMIAGTRDPLGNTVAAVNDCRVLQPAVVTDPNGNRTAVAFDTLGFVVGTAVMGKPLPGPIEGDTLDDFDADLTDAAILEHLADPLADPESILRGATSRLVYDLFAYRRADHAGPAPVVVYTLSRETHVSDPVPPGGLKIQHAFSYSDGFGREVQKKIQAEPGPVPGVHGEVSPRWVGSGWTVFNNKGKPVRQYEPFFSGTHNFEFDTRAGVSPVVFYDPVERAVATLYPDHTYQKVLFDPWRRITFDANDTVTADPRTDADVAGYVEELFRTQPADWRSWHAERSSGPDGPEKTAAAKAAKHANTPEFAYFDTLGRPFLTLSHNGFNADDTAIQFPVRVRVDIEGNTREVRDAIAQADDAQGRVVMQYAYDMLGSRIHQASMEAGDRWTLNDATGKPIRAWNSRGFQFRTSYDALRRPTDSFLSEDFGPELMVGRVVYGETRPDPQANNLRGKVVQIFDQAGVVTTDEYDFKGNLLRTERRLAESYKTRLNWPDVSLQPDSHGARTRYDALNRAVELRTPDQSTIRPGYNEANLLERIEANVGGATTPTIFIADIDYNAKGQRERIQYGNNGAVTTYEYDPLTFRLKNLKTTRPGAEYQNLHYTYDPVGNITHIRDDAQQTIYFRNKRVEPSASYTYDPIYRLIEATGREHLGQAGGPPIPHSYDDVPRVGVLHPGDGLAMGTYTESYVYDAVGNFVSMRHRGNEPAHPGWKRTYNYSEASLLEPNKSSNRLTSSTVNTTLEAFSVGGDGYDFHGNMLRMPQLQIMTWDFKDQLQMTQRQAVNSKDHEGAARQGERTFYVYGSAGQRVRKVTELATGQIKDERIYLGGVEIYRRSGTNPVVRQTLHIMDDQQRVASVETRTEGNDGSPAQLFRYQFGNHLGSASLELDDEAQIISYEEYTPYGCSSYQAVRSSLETPKRYRYTGKERDEESGLYYHGARYYAPWIASWVSVDPIGIADSANLYQFAHSNPIRYVDLTGKNGKETKTVKPQVVDQALNNVTVAEEVTFKFKHPKTGDLIQGRIDVAVPPKNELMSTAMFFELKGDPGSPRTDAQKEYIPLFEDGVEVEITSEKAGRLGLQKGQSVVLKTSENYMIIDASNLAAFKQGAKVAYQSQPGILKVDIQGTSSFKSFATKADLEKYVLATNQSSKRGLVERLPLITEMPRLPIPKGTGRASRMAFQATPWVGPGISFTSATAEATQQNYLSATLDALGAVPVGGDMLDMIRASAQATMDWGTTLTVGFWNRIGLDLEQRKELKEGAGDPTADYVPQLEQMEPIYIEVP